MTTPGSIAEEAAKLFEALGAWARNGADEAGSGIGGRAATGGHDASTCRVCPLCQLMSVVRTARPETFAHLIEASSALNAAVRSFLDNAEPEPREPRRGAPVERVDLDEAGRP